MLARISRGNIRTKSSILTDLERLFDTLYDPLLYFAFHYVKSIETAEEIVSDAFIVLWQKRDSFTDFNRVKSFLYTCVKNASLNHIRDHKVKTHQQDIDDLADVLMDDTDLLARMIRVELLELIYKKTQELPDQQQEVFRLHYIEQLSHEEISQKLNISLNTVYIHKSRALSYLKDKMKLDYLVLISLLSQSVN